MDELQPMPPPETAPPEGTPPPENPIAHLLELAAAEYPCLRERERVLFGAMIENPPLEGEVEQLLKAAAKAGGVSSGALRADWKNFLLVSAPPKEESFMADPAPWDEPVSGADVFHEARALLMRLVRMPDESADTVLLWVGLAYFREHTGCLPILHLTSATPRSGKSRLLEVIGLLCPRPLPAANCSPAALFRSVEKWNPVMLLDEVDQTGFSEELRQLLNAGHTRANAFVLRVDGEGDKRDVKRFSVYCPKVLSGIGGLNVATLADRTIPIKMVRLAPGDDVERISDIGPGVFEELRRKMFRWAEDAVGTFMFSNPRVPLANHRAADNWRELWRTADAAGGDWPERIRTATKALAGETDADELPLRVRLLQDVKAIFEDRKPRGSEIFPTGTLLELLNAEDTAPWCEINSGRPLTAHRLAKLVKPFGIKPVHSRMGGPTLRGYKPESFADAFFRYLEPAQAAHASESMTCEDTEAARPVAPVPISGSCNSNITKAVPLVPLQNGGNGGFCEDVPGIPSNEGADGDEPAPNIIKPGTPEYADLLSRFNAAYAAVRGGAHEPA